MSTQSVFLLTGGAAKPGAGGFYRTRSGIGVVPKLAVIGYLSIRVNETPQLR